MSKRFLLSVAAVLAMTAITPLAFADGLPPISVGGAVPVIVPLPDMSGFMQLGVGALAQGGVGIGSQLIQAKITTGYLHQLPADDRFDGWGTIPLLVGFEAAFGASSLKPFLGLDLGLMYAISWGNKETYTDARLGFDLAGGLKYAFGGGLVGVGKAGLMVYDATDPGNNMAVGISLGVDYYL